MKFMLDAEVRVHESKDGVITVARDGAKRHGEQRPGCGCPECDNGIQPGHFACEVPNATMLELERDGLVVRAYDDGAWRWFVVV